MAIFCLKVYISWRKSATKFLYVKAISNRVVRHLLASLSMQNGWWGTSFSTWKFGWKWPHLLQKHRFLSLNNNLWLTSKRYEIRCKLVLITNRKSHTGFQLAPTSLALNNVVALILHYCTEFDSFGGWLSHSGWRSSYNVCRILSSTLAKIDSPCSMVSLR